MTLVLADRVKDSTTTTGTGTVTLSGTAPTGYQTFGAGVGDGNTTYYTISGGLEWEVGIGTYTAAGTTLSRSTVISSSNAGSLVVFSAGTKDVFVTYPASRAMPLSQFSYSTTATAGGTTTLVASSNYLQYFTGTSNQNVQLPLTSTLSLGWSYHIVNNSTANLSIYSSNGASLVATVIPGTTIHVTCILTTGSTNASWDFGITDFENRTGTGSVVLGTGPTITAGVYNGTVGATTPSTGAFTTVSASVNFSGSLNGSVGAITPSSGDFTVIRTSSTSTLSADAVFGAFYTPTTVYSIGYRGIPQIGGASKTTNYTLVIGDSGGHVYLTGSTASQTVTIPANASVAFPIGTTISIVNGASVTWSVAITTDTLTLAGTASTGTRTLAVNAVVTCVKVTATAWFISGAGVT
jgi:hypothetical protein